MSLEHLNHVEIVGNRFLRVDTAEIPHEHPKLTTPHPQATTPVNPNHRISAKIMSSSKLTKRHSRYLARFKRQRKKCDLYSKDSDIQRLRRAEKSHLVLIIFFTGSAYSWIKNLIVWTPSSFVSLFILAWIIYMFYDYYWVTKSVDHMICSSIENIPETLESHIK